jgi:hypothetical protein
MRTITSGRVCVKLLGGSLRAIAIAPTHGKFDLRRIVAENHDAHPVVAPVAQDKQVL